MAKDEIYRDNEKAPEIHACLIHSQIPALQTYEVREIHNAFKGVRYGLCPACVKALANDAGFVKFLDRQLSKRLDQLEAQMELKKQKEGEKNE